MAAIAQSALTLKSGRGFNVTNDPDFVEPQDSKPRFKKIYVTAPSTADDTDTFDTDLADYGCTKFMGIIGFTHSTEDSVIIEEAPTTTVNGTVVTITVGGSTNDKKRFFVLYAL